MNSLRKILLAAAAVLALGSVEANAAGQVLCQGDVSGASTGARVVVVTSSTASPQPSYTLNSGGCALIAQADIGFFQSLGFTAGYNGGTLLFTTGVAIGTTDFVVGNLPAGAYIKTVVLANSVAAAVTGGVSLGSTANGTDIDATTAVGSSAIVTATDAALAKRVFSLTAATAIHAAAVTAWNSTNVTITVIWEYF